MSNDQSHGIWQTAEGKLDVILVDEYRIGKYSKMCKMEKRVLALICFLVLQFQLKALPRGAGPPAERG